MPTEPVLGVGGNAFREVHALARVAASGRDAQAHHAAAEELRGDALHPGRYNKEDVGFLNGAGAGATESYDQAGEAGIEAGEAGATAMWRMLTDWDACHGRQHSVSKTYILGKRPVRYYTGAWAYGLMPTENIRLPFQDARAILH